MDKKLERRKKLAEYKANLSANINFVETVLEGLDDNRAQLDNMLESDELERAMKKSPYSLDVELPEFESSNGDSDNLGYSDRPALQRSRKENIDLEEGIKINRSISRFNMI